MNRRRAPFGFAVDAGLKFKVGGRRFYVGANGIRTLSLLAEMYHALGPDAAPGSVLRLRKQVRQIEELRTRNVLSLVIMRTHSRRLRVLAIWMRGRCGGSIGTPIVTAYCHDPDDQTRKAVVRALKRMEAWSELREMADHDPSPQIRRMAETRPPRPFVTRMSAFTSHSEHRPTEPASRKLFVSRSVDFGDGRPAKSPTFIRIILERIRHILVGHPH